jgi:hypothetical protein
MQAMNRTHHTMRWAVAASLILSLTLMELFPQSLVCADGGAVVVAAPAAMKCCCGTADGRCDGMGCCAARQAPAKEQPPAPNQRDDRDGRTNPLAVAFANSPHLCAAEQDGLHFRRSATDVARSLADSSLQTRHIRMNA